MSAGQRVVVSNSVITWAREQRGLSIDVAAKRLGISTDKLASMESGESLPTMTQLKNMADKYKRPLIVLLLDEPPKGFTAMKDFRRLPDAEQGEYSPTLRDEVRRAEQQQEIYAELRSQLKETVSRPALVRLDVRIDRSAAAIRSLLDVPVAKQQRWSDPRDALSQWRMRVESLGILVLEASRVPMREMRGFSLSPNLPYVIVVNGEDSPRGKIFTMLHELAHLCVRQPGVCDLHSRSTGTSDIEIFCNAIAGEALLPQKVLQGLDVFVRHTSGTPWTDHEIERIVAVGGGASTEVVLRRLVELGEIRREEYEKRRNDLQEKYEEWRRARSKKSKGGPPPYRIQLRDRGRPFVKSVFDAYADGLVNLSEVVDLVGVRTKHLNNMQHEAYL